MRLERLTLQNFKGLRAFTLHANAEVVAVYGDNATGKTTLADAFSWLLFGKDSHNNADFEIKTLDALGQPVRNTEHAVEAVLTRDDGREITLRRVYYEKYTKKRGAAQAELTGHTTDYYVDGVPVKKREYEQTVSALADESVFRLLTDPRYFNEQMHWKARRSLLLDVCGDVGEAEVIATSSELAELPGILNGRSIDDHRKIATSRRQEINKELERIPVRIDELQRGLPEAADRASVETEIERLEAERTAKSEELTRLRAGGQVAELKRQRAEAGSALEEARRRARETAGASIEALQRRHRELSDQLARQDAEAKRLRDQLRRDQAELDQVREKQTAKRAEWQRIKAETLPEPSVDDLCPSCGQTLPSDQVAAARQQAIERLNEDKAKRLEENVEEGRRLKQHGDWLEKQIGQTQERLDEVEKALGELGDWVADLDSQIANADEPNTEADPEVQRLQGEVERLDSEIAAIDADSTEAATAAQRAINEINTAIQAQQGRLATIDAREQSLARIEELQAEEKRLAGEYERLERELYLCDQFTRAKVRLLTERINARFSVARFRLFDELVNGGIEETCETTVDGVPWGSLNNGARIAAGLDIIETLGEHYGVRAPIFIDNAESVTDIPSTTAQQILLVVSGGHPSLHVVTHATEREAV